MHFMSWLQNKKLKLKASKGKSDKAVDYYLLETLSMLKLQLWFRKEHFSVYNNGNNWQIKYREKRYFCASPVLIYVRLTVLENREKNKKSSECSQMHTLHMCVSDKGEKKDYIKL